MMQTTHDSIAMRGAGIMQITQPAKGHRFTIDSILLADFCRVRAKEQVLEPGAGSGIVSLLLAKKHPQSRFYPVEIQGELSGLCEQNRRFNGLENIISVHRDIRRLSQTFSAGMFDVIVTNPPYVKAGTGRTSPDAGRKTSRMDLLAGIEFWIELRKFLKQGGRYNIIFPAARLAEICTLMRTRKLEPKRVRLVHSNAGRPASLALIEAVKDSGTGLAVLPPLFVREASGEYTQEMRDIYASRSKDDDLEHLYHRPFQPSSR
jgi:tRNA1Val (adenine37-N6)-methyltransferase